MTIDQAKEVADVLKRFNANEEKLWTMFDEHMCNLTWLSDIQLVVESEVFLDKHKQGNARCNISHPKEECFVPVILRSVGYIVDDFAKTKRLPRKTRYILEYYICFSQTGGIVVDNY